MPLCQTSGPMRTVYHNGIGFQGADALLARSQRVMIIMSLFPSFNILGDDASQYPSIADETLSTVSSQIPGHDVDRFILQYLQLPEPMLSHIKETNRDNTVKIMFDSLVRWRNIQECWGETTGPLLDDLLQQFSNKRIPKPTTNGMLP